VQGFDRLTRANYTQDQIARLRSVFHSVNHTDNLPDDARFALEDEWVPAITLAGSPVAALRVIQLMAASGAGNPRPIRTVHTLEPPREFGSEAESPLLQPEEPEAPPEGSSWVPFIMGVVIGMMFGKDVIAAVPFFMCGFPLIGVGLAFGSMLMVVLRMG
jgi:hypothetical protein